LLQSGAGVSLAEEITSLPRDEVCGACDIVIVINYVTCVQTTSTIESHQFVKVHPVAAVHTRHPSTDTTTQSEPRKDCQEENYISVYL